MSLRPAIILLQGHETHAAVTPCIVPTIQSVVSLLICFALSHRHIPYILIHNKFSLAQCKYKSKHMKTTKNEIKTILTHWVTEEKEKSLTSPYVHLFQQTRCGRNKRIFPSMQPVSFVGPRWQPPVRTNEATAEVS